MSLVGWWPLTGDDGTVPDFSGNGNNGSNSGSTGGVAGRAGLQARDFNGSGNRIVLPDNITSVNSNLTLSVWINANTLGSDDRFISYRGDTHNIILNIGRSGSNQVGVWFNGTDYSVQTIDTNQWYHITLTWDASSNTLKVYVNSTEQLSTSESNGTDSSRTPSIGARDDGDTPFDGQICEYRVYNRTLGANEIQTLYEWGSADYAQPAVDGVARYALDGDVTDSFGTNDGTNNGVTFSSDAIRGQSGDFEEANLDYIDTGVSLAGESNITLSMWGNLDNLGSNHVIIGSGNSSGFDNYSYVHNSNGVWNFGLEGDGFTGMLQYDDNTQPNTWYHIVAMLEGGTYKLFINGNLVQTANGPSSVPDNGPFWIGRTDQLGESWDGRIDDVRIYDRALSSAEVFELYKWGTRGRDMRKDLVNAR